MVTHPSKTEINFAEVLIVLNFQNLRYYISATSKSEINNIL
jgi:hypothetical protein